MEWAAPTVRAGWLRWLAFACPRLISLTSRGPARPFHQERRALDWWIGWGRERRGKCRGGPIDTFFSVAPSPRLDIGRWAAPGECKARQARKADSSAAAAADICSCSCSSGHCVSVCWGGSGLLWDPRYLGAPTRIFPMWMQQSSAMLRRLSGAAAGAAC